MRIAKSFSSTGKFVVIFVLSAFIVVTLRYWKNTPLLVQKGDTETQLRVDTKMKVVITGASGVLGRAVVNHFHSQPPKHIILPLSYTRTSSPLLPSSIQLIPLDLLDFDATSSFLRSSNQAQNQSIDWIIHCAAERRPDVAERDPERAEKLNVDVVKHLVGVSDELGCGMIYISTDYVFDGKNPPYSPSDPTSPLNAYGQSKSSGEVAVLRSREMKMFVPDRQHLEVGGTVDRVGMQEGGWRKERAASVLRVPILYGETEYNSETAVNVLVDVIEDQSGKEYTMDHFAVRFPTCVEDVARVIYDLTTLESPTPLPPIIHFSSTHPFTKYQMTEIIAKHLQLPITHVIPDSIDPSTRPGAEKQTQRPGNTQLDVGQTRVLLGGGGGDEGSGLGVEERKGFEEWWRDWAGRRKAVEGKSGRKEEL